MQWWYSSSIAIWLITIAVESSEILIIRHGRSRSRHSAEKEHVRWGLKAFDNSTIFAESRDAAAAPLENVESETNASGGGGGGGNGSSNRVLNFYEHNGTLSQSSDFNGTIGSYEINYTYGPSRTTSSVSSSSSSEEHNRRHHKTPPTTTEMSQIPVHILMERVTPNKVRRNGGGGGGSGTSHRKSEIISSIKNTVNKGIQYLKSHENLDEIEIEINDMNANRKRIGKGNKMRSAATQQQQQQQRKSHSAIPKQIKINGEGKEFTSIVTVSSNKSNVGATGSLKLKKAPTIASAAAGETAAASNHIKIHQAHNEIDMNIKSNLADIFYGDRGRSAAQNNNNNNNNDDEAEMLSDEPAGNVAHKIEIKESLMEKSNQRKYDANQNRTVAAITDKKLKKMNATHANEMKSGNESTTETSQQLNANRMMSDAAEFTQNDEHDVEEVEIIDDISIQNDEISTIDLTFEAEGGVGAEFDENSENFNGIYQLEDVDLSNYDETSKNNRKNLLRGRDVVTRFLQIVESQHMLGNNCTAGTALNLGEGVVDRYAQDRFRVEAEVAVNRANMLTRIFKMSPIVQSDINLLHASVLSMVEFDEDIFAAGHCFDENQYPLKKGLFCPFAHRLPAPESATLAKDLANEYHYLGNTSEWFFQARKNAEKIVARNEQYIKAYHSYTNDSDRHAEEILSVKYEDGRWSKPYYDCGGGNIWMLTYTVPFFGYENGTYFFKGTSGIDIDLRRVDIDQCPQMKNSGALQQPLNIFAGTDKCKQRTTECIPLPGLGFRRGSYKCVCRKGFYYPDVKLEFKYFNGTHMEEEYAKWMQHEPSFYSDITSFECLPCAEGCDVCEDASPCVAELNWPMRTSILVLACAVIGFLPPAAAFTFRYQQVKIVKAASPALLRVIAMGAFLIYCTTIVMYPNPSLYTCVAKIWLRELGFSLTYGALMLKTWRISVIFRVRSAKAVKITDASLIKKLSLLCGFVSVALLIRTLVSPPDVIVGRTADNLKAFLCKTDWWDHTFTSLEVLFLAWGVRLCIVVRKAPSEFNESRFISMAIYNEFLLTCFLNVSMLFLQSPANPDLLYIIFFCHTQLTVTLLLALIFGSKVYLVLRSGGKSLEEASHNKSAAAKFISHKPRATYTSGGASSVNASTGQLHYPMNGNDNRLSENEAVEEIKQLAQQLQKLHDRIPQKCSATNVILTLLDICRTAQHNAGGVSNQLKPPPLPQIQYDQPQQQQQLETKLLSKSVVDKETNTSRENLTCCRISDKCDNQNSCSKRNGKKKKGRSKCCEVGITCSTNSINFDNLQLQCMCSSDNNSEEEDEEEGCSHHHAGNFRERLLMFSGASKQDDSHLRKRASELVLGTNFDTPVVYRNNQSHRISKTFDSCDNIYKPSSKSNHSLSTESDQKSIPYTYLERPTMKLSQSEDKNLRELKIALSTNLPSANMPPSSSMRTQQQPPIAQIIATTQHNQASTSTSSTSSSKIDKISFSLSTSSTSDALTKRQNNCGNNKACVNALEELQQHELGIDNQGDRKSEDDFDDNKMITTTVACDNNNKTTVSTVNNSSNNNNNINVSNGDGASGSNGGSRKRKGAESKLAIDLNDRSKYTEEVSV